MNLSMEEMLAQKINQEVRKDLNKALEELKKLLPSIQIQVKQEIYQSFKLITSIIIEQEFVKHYGQSFDLNSLQNSLIYIPSGSSLDIDISYDSSVFRFNDKYYRDMNKFNQNARRWERKNRKYFNPSFYTDSGSYADFYDQADFSEYTDSDITDSEDYLEELLMDYDDMTFNSKRNPFEIRNIDKTYNTAIGKAKQGFNKEWQRSLKNRLEKKYGIKLTD